MTRRFARAIRQTPALEMALIACWNCDRPMRSVQARAMHEAECGPRTLAGEIDIMSHLEDPASGRRIKRHPNLAELEDDTQDYQEADE